jgi:hypothetical protein
MALNLIRNARAFFTTNVNATTGEINPTGALSSNTYEIQVLDGFSFSQNTNSETITISEAGTTPARGQRSFNTSLAPVDFSFSTYVRPDNATGIVAEESVLWNALFSPNAINATAGTITAGTSLTVTYANTTGLLTIGGTGITVSGIAAGDRGVISGISGMTTNSDGEYVNAPATVVSVSGTSIVFQMHNPYTTAIAGTLTTTTGAFKLNKTGWVPVTATANYAVASGATSNTNQLQKFGMVVYVDQVCYAIDNCALNQVTIDFGLDGIATLQWTGQATALREITSTVSGNAHSGAGFAGSSQAKYTAAKFITNKLSTATLKTVTALKNSAGTTIAAAGKQYYIALTGGSLTINNNISYITPAILGIVNQPVAYYTGTRSVTGSLNAYLNTGTLTGTVTDGTGNLLKDMLSAASATVEPMFAIELAIGGSGNTVRVEAEMPAVSLGIPAINTEQVVSTTINFTAAPSTYSTNLSSRVYELGESNEITVRYFA